MSHTIDIVQHAQVQSLDPHRLRVAGSLPFLDREDVAWVAYTVHTYSAPQDPPRMTSHRTPQSHESDGLLTALADAHCRAVLRYFREAAEPTTTVTALAQQLTGADRTTDQETIRLPHCTLPRLDDAGLLDYDPVDHTVRYQPTQRVGSLLDKVGEHDP